jgi:hypothetical protein
VDGIFNKLWWNTVCLHYNFSTARNYMILACVIFLLLINFSWDSSVTVRDWTCQKYSWMLGMNVIIYGGLIYRIMIIFVYLIITGMETQKGHIWKVSSYIHLFLSTVNWCVHSVCCRLGVIAYTWSVTQPAGEIGQQDTWPPGWLLVIRKGKKKPCHVIACYTCCI